MTILRSETDKPMGLFHRIRTVSFVTDSWFTKPATWQLVRYPCGNPYSAPEASNPISHYHTSQLTEREDVVVGFRYPHPNPYLPRHEPPPTMAEEATVDHQGVDGPPDGLYRYERTANKRVPTLEDVTEEDLGFFEEYGYLVIDQALTDEEVQAARDGMMSLLEAGKEDLIYFEPGLVDDDDDPSEWSPEVKHDYVRKFMHFVDHSDGMRAPSEKPALLEVLSKLVDGEPERFADQGMIKPPGGREKPWHQDKAYFETALDAPVVGVWMALDPALPENGCMHVIPGSHRDGPVVHFDRRDWQICDTDVQVDEDVMVPLEPGGLLFFDGLIHHGTPPNDSDKRRRAMQFHYTAADAEWLEERPDAFGNADKDVTC